MVKKYQGFLLIKLKYINFNKESTYKKKLLTLVKYVKRESKIEIKEGFCYNLYKNKFTNV